MMKDMEIILQNSYWLKCDQHTWSSPTCEIPQVIDNAHEHFEKC